MQVLQVFQVYQDLQVFKVHLVLMGNQELQVKQAILDLLDLLARLELLVSLELSDKLDKQGLQEHRDRWAIQADPDHRVPLEVQELLEHQGNPGDQVLRVLREILDLRVFLEL